MDPEDLEDLKGVTALEELGGAGRPEASGGV